MKKTKHYRRDNWRAWRDEYVTVTIEPAAIEPASTSLDLQLTDLTNLRDDHVYSSFEDVMRDFG
jgi:hypothetical protein